MASTTLFMFSNSSGTPSSSALATLLSQPLAPGTVETRTLGLVASCLVSSLESCS